MATVFDVEQLTVVNQEETTLVTGLAVVETINIAPAEVAVTEVTVAGPQGPPGLKNVYIQSNDPAVEFGWGPAEEGFVWLQI